MMILELPSEILDCIFSQVSRQSLKSVSLSCRRLYSLASGFIWHTIEIKDKCSPRRDVIRDGYKAECSPERDSDGDSHPGMPLIWGSAALEWDNPRGPIRQLAPPPNPADPNPNPINLNRNPLDPEEIADQERRDRDNRYAQLDGCSNALGMDQHDDTPAIRKLYLLASRPDLAAQVRVVWTRCHLPMPDMSTELVWMCTGGQTMSSDWRTLLLLRLAIKNMVNVVTLRFAMPHWNIYWIMMCDFMDSSRKRNLTVTSLWLESCSAVWDAGQWPSRCDFSTIKSIRFRRLKVQEDPRPAHVGGRDTYPPYFLARTGPPVRIRNGIGGHYFTATHTLEQENQCRPQLQHHYSKVTPDELCETRCHGAITFDSTMYSDLPEVETFLESKNNEISELPFLVEPSFMTGDGSREFHKGRRMVRWLRQQCSNLTHLNIDWLILRKSQLDHEFTMSMMPTATTEKFLFADLSKLRIKTLRSFQLRNALTLDSLLPPDIFLLTPTTFTNDATGDDLHHIDFLSFLEAHPNLICLAWPMDAFLRDELWDGARPKNTEQAERAHHSERVDVVINRLGITLETLRLDVMFHNRGEPQTDHEHRDLYARNSRDRRRLFISAVASRMQSVRTLKIEGYIPRDEKREVLRGLSSCPLERFISIGRTFPLGNTWGPNAADLEDLEGAAWNPSFWDNFEPEELPSLENLIALPIAGNSKFGEDSIIQRNRGSADASFEILHELGSVFANGMEHNSGRFEPRWGWLQSSEPPLLYSLANFFADTVTELKFCGFNGSIIYGRATLRPSPDINDIILYNLRHFHNLKNLIISYYLLRDKRFDENDAILTWICERDALWHGKDENFEDESPYPETDKINWDDIASNEVGHVDRQEMSQVLDRYQDFKLAQHALRRAFIWDKHWSIHSAIAPFPEFPDFELFQEGRRQKPSHPIPYGLHHAASDPEVLPRGPLGNYLRDPNDNSEAITMKTILPFPQDQIQPSPAAVFAPFRNSYYFTKWFHSPFLNVPIEPQEVDFFWKHVAASLQVLRYRFSPGRMADQIFSEMTDLLSPRALSSAQGVKVRASFCMGVESNDLFYLDVLMNAKEVKRYWGPRSEIDSGRWRQKNDARRYF